MEKIDMNIDIDEILKHLWDEIRVNTPGEPNLHDVKLMAQTLRLHYVDKLSTDLPKSEVGLKIVEYIDSNLFKSPSSYQIYHVVRNLTFDDFSNRLKEVVKDLQTEGYLYGGVTKTLCTAFYTWYGCIFMAKLTRPEDSIGTQYTSAMRMDGYTYLKEEWEEAEKYGNPWIKFGVTIAKPLEEKRKKSDNTKIIVDNWIPQDSPYWECLKE